MQPTYLSLSRVFGSQTRYTVPLFQRPYVWNQQDQWEPLWDDISALADRVLNSKSDSPIPGHFLGTAVLEQAASQSGTIPCREIIDGQQRLTTMQVMLKAGQHAVEKLRLDFENKGKSDLKPIETASRQIASLTENPAYDDDSERFKVWPTNQDRDAFVQVMTASNAGDLEGVETKLAEAYRYFHIVIDGWLRASEDSTARAKAFASAVQNHLRLIVLDLDDTDEPQAIFETINAHGTPLLPADLIKNWILWQAQREGISDLAGLYQKYWEGFDAEAGYWRESVGKGHAARSKIDTFLQNWLTRRTRKVVAVKHLYDQFLRHATSEDWSSVAEVMADIQADSLRFKQIQNPSGKSRFDTFLRRLAKLDMVVFHPFLMALLARTDCNQVERDKVATYLESYLVRRMICWEQTRGYGALGIQLLEALHDVPQGRSVSEAICRLLAEPSTESLAWPSDEKFKEKWCSNKFYGGYRRSRVAMILQAIELSYQSKGSKAEPVLTFDFDELEIEHILPQAWQKHWPLGDHVGARAERENKLHGIGNLTLVSGSLNPSLSHASWHDVGKKKGKRSALEEHSLLQLNARLVKSFAENWDEKSMDKRAIELWNAARKIWPLPETHGAS